MSVFMQPISTQAVGAGGASSITFSNIPQGFNDLVIKVSARTTAAQTSNALFITFNGSTSGYSHTYLINTGTSQLSGSNGYGVGTTSIFAGYAPAATSAANVFSNYEVTIPNYSSGNYKSVDMTGVYENNTTAILNWIHSGTWASNTPITSITITPEVSFAQYSSFTLYGVAEQFQGGVPIAPTLSSVTDQASFASVAFTPATNDLAQLYSITTSPASSTTYGATSPIVAPASQGTVYTYQVNAVNTFGTSSSTASSSVTTSNAFASIATQTLATAASSITFINIPQNYSHLQLRFFVGGSAVAGPYMQFNGDAGNSYTSHLMYGDGSTGSTYGQVTASPTIYLSMPGQGLASSTSYAAYVLDISDYTNTYKYKTVKGLYGIDRNGSGQVIINSGNWRSYAPITSLTFANESGNNFLVGSSFALYGIA